MRCTYNVVLKCSRCCSGKEISSTYSECVFVALGIQHAMSMRHIVICCLSGSNVFFSPHYLMKGAIFEGKKLTHNVCSHLICSFGLKHFLL